MPKLTQHTIYIQTSLCSSKWCVFHTSTPNKPQIPWTRAFRICAAEMAGESLLIQTLNSKYKWGSSLSRGILFMELLPMTSISFVFPNIYFIQKDISRKLKWNLFMCTHISSFLTHWKTPTSSSGYLSIFSPWRIFLGKHNIIHLHLLNLWSCFSFSSIVM